MRSCDHCMVKKQHIFLTLAENGRAVYKDEAGKIWHGRVCADCYTNAVWLKSKKRMLENRRCLVCNAWFKQKQIKQRRCDTHKLTRKKLGS